MPGSIHSDIQMDNADKLDGPADLENALSLVWKGVSFSTKTGKTILQSVDGIAQGGQLLAIMGPSGCGKSTLLNCLAQRQKGAVAGSVSLGGAILTTQLTRTATTYVPQEDSLIGALTVRETVDFAAKFSADLSPSDRARRVDWLLKAFGLTNQADVLVGTPLQKGISGGQKRRLSVASQLVNFPPVIFLDEPTSGLDSSSAHEVVSFLRAIAREKSLIVIASIHQPSTSTFRLFDNVLLLSQGRTVYQGSVMCEDYFKRAGRAVPAFYNPADHLLEVTNVDFTHNDEGLLALINFWEASPDAAHVSAATSAAAGGTGKGIANGTGKPTPAVYSAGLLKQTRVLTHRSFLKAYRDVLVFGVRLFMYVGLAILMGTVWLRLGDGQNVIQAYLNALFFSSAFMSFMAVAYIPAFIEDRTVLVKERANGMYGVPAFLLSNLLVGIPFLFIIAATFALITYWLIGFNTTSPTYFFTYLLFLFLDLLAAESLVVLISSIIPIFVAALAITAFANGMFMSAGGFLVNPTILNVFYYYIFYETNYQRYAFEGLVNNEIGSRVYDCDQPETGPCQCMYQTSLAGQCQISGEGVVDLLGYGSVQNGVSAAILIAIGIIMRLFSWAALHYRTQ